MSSQAARRPSTPTVRASLLSIGQVLAKLTPKFHDLSPSKLRFLEDRELVSPSRTAAGYRTYSPDDVERLRFVLTVQRDHYLPLRVIKAHLDDLDQGKNPVLPSAGALSQSRAPHESTKLTRQEMLDRSGALATVLDGAISAGLIEAKKIFSSDDLAVLNSVVEASRFGLEPRHLRGMRLAVDREVGLVSQAVSATTSSRKALPPEELREKGRELCDILMTLRQAITKDALNRLES